MAGKKKRAATPRKPPGAAAQVPGPAPEPEAAPPSTPETAPEDPEQVIAGMKDRLLRALAEVENMRQRAQRDKEEAIKYATTAFARDLLNVSDNLRRALDSGAGGEGQTDSETLKNLISGVEMTEKELLTVFERHGIAVVDPGGEKFDHQYHQAMFQVPTADHPPGTIVEVVQVGYVLRDRLLRPALVGVAADETAPTGPEQAPEEGPEQPKGVDTKV